MADIWSPLTTHWAVNYEDSEPRTAAVDSIGHHHTASPNELVSLQQFYPGGRTVTPNYFIAGKKIYGIVPENRRAYTSSDSVNDNRSITYEILNSTAGPDWAFDRDTLDSVAALDADIVRRYGVPLRHAIPGFWEHRNLNEWFNRSYPTACAGPSFNINARIAQAAASSVQLKGPEEDDMSIIIKVTKNSKDGKIKAGHHYCDPLDGPIVLLAADEVGAHKYFKRPIAEWSGDALRKVMSVRGRRPFHADTGRADYTKVEY